MDHRYISIISGALATGFDGAGQATGGQVIMAGLTSAQVV
jgi:hypothetical protein